MHGNFVHLRSHSEFSLVDGLLRIDNLMDALPTRGMNAIAITDYCNLFAAVKVFKGAISSGIKPILGADLACCHPETPEEVSSMILLCQNQTGYRHLTQLVSRAYQEGQYQGQPRIYFDWVAEHAEGLIALSGGLRGDIGKALLSGDMDFAIKLANHWGSIFPGRFYIEIQRT